MGNNCCLTCCKPNYLTENEMVCVYQDYHWIKRMTTNDQRWMNAIPRENVPDRPDTDQKHFPLDFPIGTVETKRPCVFENIPNTFILQRDQQKEGCKSGQQAASVTQL